MYEVPLDKRPLDLQQRGRGELICESCGMKFYASTWNQKVCSKTACLLARKKRAERRHRLRKRAKMLAQRLKKSLVTTNGKQRRD